MLGRLHSASEPVEEGALDIASASLSSLSAAQTCISHSMFSKSQGTVRRLRPGEKHSIKAAPRQATATRFSHKHTRPYRHGPVERLLVHGHASAPAGHCALPGARSRRLLHADVRHWRLDALCHDVHGAALEPSHRGL